MLANSTSQETTDCDFDLGFVVAETRTDTKTSTTKVFYDLAKVQPCSIVYPMLFGVTWVSLGLVGENVVTRTQSHPFRHTVSTHVRPVCVVNGDRTNVSALNGVIAPLLLAGVGRQMKCQKERGGKSRHGQTVELKRSFVWAALCMR